MSLFVLGINHLSAGLSIRERFAISLSEAPKFIQNLFSHRAVDEAMVLSTCNRTEIYTVTQCHSAVKDWLHKSRALDDSVLKTSLYEYHDTNMVKHLMAVASGLDSMIIGEPQILGQMKQAYQLALDEGTIGPQFQRLFPAVFAVAKLIRAETRIGHHPVTLAYAVVQLAKQIFPKLSDRVVLLIGAGETIDLTANYLRRQGIKELLIANRTLEHAHNLARTHDGIPIDFSEIPTILHKADLVISATASENPILHKTTVEKALKLRKRQPIFIADLAMPRDIAPDVADLEDVYLYNMDHLQTVITDNLKTRKLAAQQAHALIEIQATHYLRKLRVREAGDMIRSFRQKFEHWRDQELEKALKNLDKAHDPKVVITDLARSLTNKMMHHPTQKLRDAAYAEHRAVMDLLKELYEL
jgi:glutamyl-tRNA reductase